MLRRAQPLWQSLSVLFGLAIIGVLVACAPAAPQPAAAPKAAEPSKPGAQPAAPAAEKPAAADKPAAAPKALRPVTLILDFVPTGEYVPHFTALEKGWYKEEGLDVTIVRGQGSGDTIKRIAAGQGEVGIADMGALIAARANEDVKVKAIALWYRRPPHGIFVRADSPIKTPKDLEGKNLGISPGNSHRILWPVFEQLAGLRPNSVNWVTMDATAMPPALISGRVDAVPFFVVHEARISKIAKQQNVELRLLTAWADLGLDINATSLIARDETIANDPDLLKAFLRATFKGLDYTYRQKNFEEGVRNVVKHHPEVDPDGALGAAQVGSRFVYAEEVTSGRVAVGQFEPARVEKTRDIYTQYLELKRRVPIEELFTNDLLPEKK